MRTPPNTTPTVHRAGSHPRDRPWRPVAVVTVLEIAVLVVGLWVAPSPASATPISASTGGYGWPIQPRPRVVTPFSPGEHRWQPGHRGVDLAAAPGTVVVAAGAGTVHHVGVVAGRPVVSILHPDGLLTTYEPVDPGVRAGQSVARGDPIGTLLAGHPGCPTAGCLHWGARRGAGHAATYLNPLGLVSALRVRLLPLER
ncbi:M23 family metallopeptidase [Williamsia sterculiae]|uniref:Peptidase family M23 n=1 Tax=Williamsia sterculiae TaxID=1344003 RepID=A0A1N7GF07_9NOCA|nr:M23 family metallopeptidase [Williamsia sterculiae]SIS11128.1 Peptidase family M23 [Williamsia sterculiae]